MKCPVKIVRKKGLLISDTHIDKEGIIPTTDEKATFNAYLMTPEMEEIRETHRLARTGWYPLHPHVTVNRIKFHENMLVGLLDTTEILWIPYPAIKNIFQDRYDIEINLVS